MKRSPFACRANLIELAALGKVYLWTFTRMPIHESIKDQRDAWNKLLTYLKRKWPNWKGVRVFEMHKVNEAGLTHGMHVHVVTTGFISVTMVRLITEKLPGWGRIHVKQIPSDKVLYIAKYLEKARPEAFKGWRLWASFGEYAKTRVLDVLVDTPFTRVYEWLDGRFPDSFAASKWYVRESLCNLHLEWFARCDVILHSHGFRGEEDHKVWLSHPPDPAERPDRRLKNFEPYLKVTRPLPAGVRLEDCPF